MSQMGVPKAQLGGQRLISLQAFAKSRDIFLSIVVGSDDKTHAWAGRIGTKLLGEPGSFVRQTEE